MSIQIGTPRSWLQSTAQLDLTHPKIRITALKLTQSLYGNLARARAIHDFVRRIPFGAWADVSEVHASEVMKKRHGDCHAKGVLFVALCRASQVPARLNFVRIKPRFLDGILEDGPESMAHAVGQVLVNDQWVSTDGYVVDPVLFAQAKQRLREEGRDCGWGIRLDADASWDGVTDCIHQFSPEDLLHNYGAYHDLAEFYDELRQDEGSPSWVARLKYSVGAGMVNRRIGRLRGTPGMVEAVQVPARYPT